LSGQLYLTHISFPPQLIADAGIKVALNEPSPLPRGDSTVGTTPTASSYHEPGPTFQRTFRILRSDELFRLAGRSVEKIGEPPISPLQRLARDLDAPVVLQEHKALIGLPDGRVFINPSGNSRWPHTDRAKVLHEAVCLVRARGLPLNDAVRTGVFLEGVAADLSARASITTSPRARDVTEHLSEAMKLLEEDYSVLTTDYYGTLEVI
jgi:hypothetical protein